MKFRLAGFLSESITDGTGFRAVVFFQGCLRACPGCQNPQTHDPAGGSESTTEEMIGKILADPYLDGVTLSGGEPFFQPEPAAEIAEAVKAAGKNVWAFTGYTYEELRKGIEEGRKDWERLLKTVDVLVDGPFVEAERDISLAWRGSRNQRVIRLRKCSEQQDERPADDEKPADYGLPCQRLVKHEGRQDDGQGDAQLVERGDLRGVAELQGAEVEQP